MGLFDSNGTERQSTEFAKAVPTNGFGEVEATVIASLGHPGAPRPRDFATAKMEKKVCRIYSPVSVDRRTGGLGGWHRQQQDFSQRPHTVDNTGANRHRPRGLAAVGLAATTQGANLSARATEVPECVRPMTSDSLSRPQHHHSQRGETARSFTRNHLCSDTAGSVETNRQVRQPQSDDRRKQGLAGPTARKDTRAAPGAIGMAHRTSSRDEKGEPQLELRRQQGQRPPSQGESKRRQHTSELEFSKRPMTADSVNRSVEPKAVPRRTEEYETPPNRYWPTPGGAKEFLRPFIERNHKHLWAYDPAFVGMDHVQAYRHVVSKGDFEAVKRTLLEKEDALTKGTGSFLILATFDTLTDILEQMADVIERFRGNTGRRSAPTTPPTEDGPHRKRTADQRSRRRSFPSTRSPAMTDSDPFLSGACNSDKLRKEEARRRELLQHAGARTNVFCRRKGYEPGDFLKRRPPTVVNTRENASRSARPSNRARKRTVEGVGHERVHLL